MIIVTVPTMKRILDNNLTGNNDLKKIATTIFYIINNTIHGLQRESQNMGDILSRK